MKCLYIEVITASPRRQHRPLALSSGAPKLQGREDARLPQLTGSTQLLHRGGGKSVCLCVCVWREGEGGGVCTKVHS